MLMKNRLFRMALGLISSLSIIPFASCYTPQNQDIPPNLPVPPVFQSIHSIESLVFGMPEIFQSSYSCISHTATGAAFTLDAKLPSTPNTMTIYRIVPPAVNYTYATRLAKQLGFTSEPTQTSLVGNLKSFDFVENMRSLSIMSDGSVEYIDNNIKELPAVSLSDSESINFARDWLEAISLHPKNILRFVTYPVSIVGSQIIVGSTVPSRGYQLGVGVDLILGVDGYELAGMGASVWVGGDGRVFRASIKILELAPYTTAKIKKPKDAVSLFQTYLKNPAYFLHESPECLVDYVWGNMTASDITIKYFCMVSLDNTQPIYAQPIYVLEGGGSSPFYGRVDGLAR